MVQKGSGDCLRRLQKAADLILELLAGGQGTAHERSVEPEIDYLRISITDRRTFSADTVCRKRGRDLV